MELSFHHVTMNLKFIDGYPKLVDRIIVNHYGTTSYRTLLAYKREY
jgi:hypothetical protein